MSTFTKPSAVVALTLAKDTDINDLADATEAAFALIPDEDQLARGTTNYVTAAGAGNAYTVSMPTTLGAYVDGYELVMKANHTNTGAATIDIDGLGAKSLRRQNGEALAAGDIQADKIVPFRYNATSGYFEMQMITTGNMADVATVAGISANVTTVAGDSADIGTIATDLNGANTIGTVSGIAADVSTVAGISADVSTVAGISANVTTVAGDTVNIGTVAANLTGANTIGTVAAIDGDVTTVAGISANVTTVAGDTANIGTIATDLNGADTIGAVAGIAANVTTVAGISADVTAVAAIATEIQAASYFSRKNHIINGNFDVWQRGTSFTSSGYCADHWRAECALGSTMVHTQQPFPLGQTKVPNNPEYFCRTVATTGGGVTSFIMQTHRIEFVKTLSGVTATFSFYAKADAVKNMTVEFNQYFGTGGSPSATVTTIGVTKVALTTSWQKFTVTVALPSISGKTLGTDLNDYLAVNFWFDAGSDFDARTDSLGNQSGTFDIAQVQLEQGSVATPFEPRTYGE